MWKTDDRFRSVGADALFDTDLIATVCFDNSDAVRGNLNRVLRPGFADSERFRLLNRREVNRADQFTLINDFRKVLGVAFLAQNHPCAEESDAENGKGEGDQEVCLFSQEITRTFPPFVTLQRSASPEVTRTSPFSVIMIASNLSR